MYTDGESFYYRTDRRSERSIARPVPSSPTIESERSTTQRTADRPRSNPAAAERISRLEAVTERLEQTVAQWNALVEELNDRLETLSHMEPAKPPAQAPTEPRGEARAEGRGEVPGERPWQVVPVLDDDSVPESKPAGRAKRSKQAPASRKDQGDVSVPLFPEGGAHAVISQARLLQEKD